MGTRRERISRDGEHVAKGSSDAVCGAIAAAWAGLPAVGSSLDPSSKAGAQRLTPSPRVSFARLGTSLAAGHFDDDGFDDLAISAPRDTVDGLLEAGSMTILYGTSTGLVHLPAVLGDPSSQGKWTMLLYVISMTERPESSPPGRIQRI